MTRVILTILSNSITMLDTSAQYGSCGRKFLEYRYINPLARTNDNESLIYHISSKIRYNIEDTIRVSDTIDMVNSK